MNYDSVNPDVYFNNSAKIAKKFTPDTYVLYRYFARKSGLFFGTDFIKKLSQSNPWGEEPTIDALPEGTYFSPNQVIMQVTGKFEDIVNLETDFLSILTISSTALNMQSIVREANERPVYDFSARHYPKGIWGEVACAAKLGGASGCSTNLGAYWASLYPYGNEEFAKNGVGTTPHALSAVMPENKEIKWRLFPEVKNAVYFAQLFPNKPAVVLNDYSGKELDVTKEACEVLKDYPNFWGVRLDTCGERVGQGGTESLLAGDWVKWLTGKGVTVPLCKNVREVMDACGCKDKKIMVSSGFDAKKTEFFVKHNAPFDAIGTGSFVEFNQVTADITHIKIEDRWEQRVKAGREWLAKAPSFGLERIL